MQPTTQLLLSQDQQHRKAREDGSLVTARLSRCVGRDFADYCTSDNQMLSEPDLRPGVRRWLGLPRFPTPISSYRTRKSQTPPSPTGVSLASRVPVVRTKRHRSSALRPHSNRIGPKTRSARKNA